MTSELRTTAERTDRYGFPIQTCSRCGGSGRYSYCQMYGDRCFKCEGKGVTHTPKAHALYQAWASALRAHRNPTVADLKVGDGVATTVETAPFKRKIVGHVNVTAIEIDRNDVRGQGSVQACDLETGKPITLMVDDAWAAKVFFDDGSVLEASTCMCVRRIGWIDPAPYVEKAKPIKRRTAARWVVPARDP